MVSLDNSMDTKESEPSPQQQLKCTRLREFVFVQIDIIKRHLDKHKWYNGIADETTGTVDFVRKYGWLMRDVYCHHVCDRATECPLADACNNAHERAGLAVL